MASLDSNEYIVSVQHTGTRELARQFGCDLNASLPTQRVQHVHHFRRSHHGAARIFTPTRHPELVLVSWVKRYGDGCLDDLLRQLGHMEQLMRDYHVTRIPVDLPDRARQIGEIYGKEFGDWEMTGHLPLRGEKVVIPDFAELVVALKKFELFRVYR